ncbi:MAG: baseplate J/gp47 family protein [Hydrogenoanaerobacterium sp.]
MKSYEELLQLMLAQVPNDMDKRSGSVILAALAPVAAMLAEQQCYLDNVMNAAMPDTARGENLTRKCAELGVVRHKATNAVRKAILTGAPVPIGSRFGADGIIYEVILKISASEYQVKCQQTGAIGNSYFGALLPIDIISDLESAALGEIIAAGEDEETDSKLRTRFYAAMSCQPFGGNVAQYKAELEKIPGVGTAKVFPTPDGHGGTVQCIITDPQNRPVSSALLAQVQELIDPTPQGKGYGIAPIGHVATISTVAALTVNIAANLTLKNDYTVESLSPLIDAAIRKYFDGLAFTESIVRISRIEAAILNIDGIIDVSGTTLNGTAANLILSSVWNLYQIPTLGSLILTEVY